MEEPVNNDGVDNGRRRIGGARYVGMNSDGEKPTMEDEDRGTIYSIRSFRDPENDDALDKSGHSIERQSYLAAIPLF